ncbi:unnamed protein product [Musa textilis]
MAAAAIEIFIPILRVLLCFVVTIPALLAWQVVPRAVPRHHYAALSGADLSFGASFNLHFVIPLAVGYAGVITFFTGFDYLVG